MTFISPCKTVIMTRVIPFWRTGLLTRDNSGFIKDIHCLLSFRAYWLNLVRASMCAVTSFRPMEDTNMVAKWLYQWKIEYAYLVLRGERLAIFVTKQWLLPCAQVKPRVQQPNHQGGNHSQRFVSHNHWVPFRATQYIRGQHNQSVPNQSLSLNVAEWQCSSIDIQSISSMQLSWFC